MVYALKRDVEPGFFTVKEAARYIRVSEKSLHRYMENADGPPVRRFGRNAIRFPITEFIAWANRPYVRPPKRKK